jgi:hypothetical protein
MTGIRLLGAAAVIPLVAACGGGSSPTILPIETLGATSVGTASPEAPLWRYVNSGWVSPYDVPAAEVFTGRLRVYVITSQEELDAFHRSITVKRSQGTATSLGRVKFPDSVLLAAYYLWRPLQGDPLSVTGITLEGHQTTVELELAESPQGKEYPYLYAPMTMVSVDRSLFPKGEPLSFVFQLNGEPATTVLATIE